MKHKQLKEIALEAISKLHKDTSVGNLVTRDSLVELKREIDLMIQGIDDDIERDLS